MKMTGARSMIEALELEGVDVIFGYPGAAICPFYDALIDSKIEHILTRHEQGAVHAANGYARVTGKPGACVVTSGPGATNAITGIATAYMDSVPMVIISGQVSTELIGRDVFQEADITGATEPFCKHSYLVRDANDLPRIMKEAFHIASTGRPGPVLVDVPIDVQTQEARFEYPNEIEIRGYKPILSGHAFQIKKISETIEKSKSPVVCAGGGMISSGACNELLELVVKARIPVVTTLMGKGAIPTNHEMYLGMIGSHGVYTANYAINNADTVLFLGARIGDRAIGGAALNITKKAKIIHIDIDPAEIGKNIGANIPVVGHIKHILAQLNKVIKSGNTDEWIESVLRIRKEHPLKIGSTTHSETVNPKYILSILSDYIDTNTVVTTEVGQNQIWAANYVNIEKAGTFISSGGMGTMGYGLPAAIGACIGKNKSETIVISGDGSFQMSMQELGVIKEKKLPIKIILLNNSRLGMVCELQKNRYNGRYSGVFLNNNPDFIQLFKAYGFKGERIQSNAQVKDALYRMSKSEEAFLLECIVDPSESTL